MIPGDYTLHVLRGRSLRFRLECFSDADATVLVDLTGCTVEAAIRPVSGDAPQVPLTATVVDADGVTPEDGVIEIAAAAEDTALLTGTYYEWTVVVTDTLGDPREILRGAVKVRIDPNL